MTTKTTKTLYWIFTILFAALMIFSAVGGIGPSENAVKMIHDGMGFPNYFIQFISIAKIVGSIAILIPGLKTIKEWAYAGLFFDLVGAVYSMLRAFPSLDPGILGMLIWFAAGMLSYYFWTKLNKS
ncbi:MAG: DoxX family protein [Sphingobacteriales bacterium]|nr:MAG: DoxX family protein [Sphingobacteriales bacterium]